VHLGDPAVADRQQVHAGHVHRHRVTTTGEAHRDRHQFERDGMTLVELEAEVVGPVVETGSPLPPI